MPKVNLGMGAGDWIARALRKSKISQAKLAQALNRRQQTVNKQILENRIDYEMLQMVFKMVGADQDVIVNVMKGNF